MVCRRDSAKAETTFDFDTFCVRDVWAGDFGNKWDLLDEGVSLRETRRSMATSEEFSPPLVKKPGWLRRLYDWTLSWAHKPHGTMALFIIAFMESSFFPIPPDILLIALCVGHPEKAMRKALVCTVGSVLGGMAGYAIGWGAWGVMKDWFIPTVFSQANFDKVGLLFQDNAFLSIFTAAFTPIPYKVFTVTAGVFHVSFLALILASIVGRGMRFFLIAGLIRVFGAKVRLFIEKYFDILAWVALVVGIAGFVLLKYLH
jgi:membrane protein YqaA with SNARE-associated domain